MHGLRGAAAVMGPARRSGSVCASVGLGSYGRLCILCCSARDSDARLECAGDSWVPPGSFPFFQRYVRINSWSSSVMMHDWPALKYSSLLFYDIHPDLDAIL